MGRKLVMKYKRGHKKNNEYSNKNIFFLGWREKYPLKEDG